MLQAATAMSVNLAGPHPFPSDFFRLGFSEDFLEHLEQSEALIFPSETYRTLRPGKDQNSPPPQRREVLQREYFLFTSFQPL
jgi:hypothetical protein